MSRSVPKYPTSEKMLTVGGEILKTFGIICEYNPFHTGHKYHIEKTLEKCDAVVCAMSGSFTQRGDAALFDKYTRAECAVKCGANLVVELPFFAAVSSANYFAEYGVKLLSEMCCGISFGSECGSIDELKKRKEPTTEQIKQRLKEGRSYASAAAISERGTPNDILGTEYIRAAEKYGMETITLKRRGEGYDSENADGEFISAAACRKCVSNGNSERIIKYIPHEIQSVFRDCVKNKEYAITPDILAVILRYNKNALEDNPYVKEGIENRFYEAAHMFSHNEDIFNYVKSKRYTMTMLSRIAACAYVGLKKSDFKKYISGGVEYIRVLAADKTGMEIVSNLKKSGKHIIVNYSDSKNLSPLGKEIFELEKKASDMRLLGMQNRNPQKNEYTNRFEIL